MADALMRRMVVIVQGPSCVWWGLLGWARLVLAALWLKQWAESFTASHWEEWLTNQISEGTGAS